MKYDNQYRQTVIKQREIKMKMQEIFNELDRLQNQYDFHNKELVIVEKRLNLFDEGHSESCCVACGKSINDAEYCISGGTELYPDEGEWVCSDECHLKIEDSPDNKLYA